MRKKNNNAKWNRVMALLLSGAMVLGSAPVGALAAEPDVAEVQVEDAESGEVICEEITGGDTQGEENKENLINTDEGDSDNKILIESMTINENETEMKLFVGQTPEDLPKPNISPQNASNKNVTYIAESSGVVNIDLENRKITGVNSGRTKVIVKALDGSEVSTEFLVEVRKYIEVPSENLILKEGNSQNLNAKGSSNWADSTENQKEEDLIDTLDKLKYKSSDPSIVEVDEKGNITAKKVGNAKITIAYNFNNPKKDQAICYIQVEHDWDEGEIKNQPTCTEKGKKTYKCKYDKCAETKTEEIPATGHKYDAEFTWSPDKTKCTAKLVCQNCRDGEAADPTEASIEEETETIEPTCTEDGQIIKKATVVFDKKTYEGTVVAKIIPKLRHKLKLTEAKKPTCKEEGNLAYYTCENCGGYFKNADGKEIYKEKGWVIPKAEHMKDAGKITTKATAAKEGVRTYTCKVCRQKERYKIPRTAFTYKLGTKSSCIVSKVSDFKSIQLPTSSVYSTTKKAFTLDTKTWTLSPTQNAYKYYKSMKTPIPLTVTTKDGKKSNIKVNFQFPDPEVKITRTTEKRQGRSVYKYMFKYDIPGATRIQVRLNTKRSSYNNEYIKDFDRYISKSKSDSNSYVLAWKNVVDSLGKGAMKFQVTAYYGKNKSKIITIVK